MPNIRELTDDERADLVAEQNSCQDGDEAGLGDDESGGDA